MFALNMRSSSLWILVLAILFAGIAIYRIEEIEEVCALTGTSREYTRYCFLFDTKPVVKVSWIERTLEKNRVAVPPHRWTRTKGDIWTPFHFGRAHSKAPTTYFVQNLSETFLHESFSDDEILKMAQDFATGDPAIQRSAFERLEQ